MNKKTIFIILGIVILAGLVTVGIVLRKPTTVPGKEEPTSAQDIESTIEKNPELKKVKELEWLQIIPLCPTCPETLVTIDGEISEISDKVITLVPVVPVELFLGYPPLPEDISFKIPVSKKAGIVSKVAQRRIEFNELEKGDWVSMNLEVKSDGNYEARSITVNAKK